MFVRRRRDVAEQYFQTDLKALGYFINEKDEVRKITNPTERFEYKVFRSQRLNELRREAFVACFRQIALERLERLGLRTFKLSQSNHHHTHVPILHTPDLAHNTKLLILFPDDNVDLGIWSIRSIDGENGTIRTGTMESIVSHAISKGYSVIIANSGALLFDPDLKTTVTSVSFTGRQKSWTLGGRIRNFDPTWNVVKGSEDPTAHVTTIFDTFVSKVVPASTKIFILAAGAGAGGVVQYFDRTFSSWSSRLSGFAFAEPTYSVTALSSSSFKQFLNKLARAYIVHDEAMGTQVADLRFGCSTFSAETLYQECIIPICETEIMEYFELAREDPEWCNPSMVFEDLTVDGENREGVQEAMERIRLQQQQQGQGVYTGHTWGDGSTPGCGW